MQVQLEISSKWGSDQDENVAAKQSASQQSHVHTSTCLEGQQGMAVHITEAALVAQQPKVFVMPGNDEVARADLSR